MRVNCQTVSIQSTDFKRMTTQQPSLSQETLARFNQQTTDLCESGRHHQSRQNSISTRRSSQSRDQQHPQHHPLPLRYLPGSCLPIESSSKSPNINTPHSPFLRQDSVSLTKRFSFGSWLQGGRASFTGLYLLQPVHEVQLKNSYITEPEKGCLFNASKVQKHVQAMLESYLDGANYNAASGSHLSQVLSDLVKSKAKEISPPRYKLVCQVVVGPRKNQGLHVSSRCLWNTQHDDFVVAMFQNHSLFALAIIHGVYFE